MAHRVSDVRNVTLIGHSHSGKTSVVDALAFLTKTTPRHGLVGDGSSISNNEPEEKDRKHTLTSHIFHFPWKDRFLQVIDTPGHPDFLADTFSSFRAVETAVLVVSATSGATFHARRLFTEAEQAGLARAIVVTHMDAENTDFQALLASLVAIYGDKVVPVTYPDASARAFAQVRSVMKGEGPDAKTWRASLEERVAETDDKLLEKYFEAGSLTEQELEDNVTKAMAHGTLIPLFVMQPDRELGVEEFLDFVAREFPSPAELPPRMAHELGKPEAAVPVPATEDGPFAGFVFKVVADPYVGRLSYVRVLRGSLAAADHAIWIARLKKAEKIGGLLSVQGKDTAPLERASAGDIIAISKVESLNYCDTVCAEATPVEFARIELPKPMYMVAVTPKARGDEQKIGGALEKLHAEDPTFVIHRDAETAELVVHGMSSLHLDIMFHKLQRRYHVGVDAHPPRIPYRETVIGKAEGHHRHKKQTGGRGQFGEVYLRVYPLERGSGFQYVDSVVGGSIPRQFIPEVEKGIRQALSKGIIAGYPVVDVAAEVYDGKYHDVDSDQISFQIAGGRAFAEGFDKAKPILLEPIMQLDIMIPMRFTGDITGSLNSIRGRLTGMETVGDFQVIRAQVPLKEVMDYSTQLRSITAGEGTFTMEFGHYDPVPAHLQAEIVAKHKRHVEE